MRGLEQCTPGHEDGSLVAKDVYMGRGSCVVCLLTLRFCNFTAYDPFCRCGARDDVVCDLVYVTYPSFPFVYRRIGTFLLFRCCLLLRFYRCSCLGAQRKFGPLELTWRARRTVCRDYYVDLLS